MTTRPPTNPPTLVQAMAAVSGLFWLTILVALLGVFVYGFATAIFGSSDAGLVFTIGLFAFCLNAALRKRRGL